CQATMTFFGAPTSSCTTVSSGPTAVTFDLQAVKQAVARGVPNVYAYSSSPPGSMKSIGQFYKGGQFIGNMQHYNEFASILTSYVTFAKNNGLTVTQLGVQNEPDQNQPYPSALWTAQEFHDFIPYLYSALGNAGYAATKILFPEPSGWSIDYGGFA